MAIKNKRIMITADSIINDLDADGNPIERKIAIHSATLTLTDQKMNVTSQYIDKDWCEQSPNSVKNDQDAFDKYVHSLFTNDDLYN